MEEFKEELEYMFHPEPDGDGCFPREFPHSRLHDVHGLSFNYMDTFNWEGASTHRYTRQSPQDAYSVHVLTKNQDIAYRLFGTALRLMGDSIIHYSKSTKRSGDIQYYPPVILTFWAGFEAFVRYVSELLISTAASLPKEAALYLRDQESHLDNRGRIQMRTKHNAVLDRYCVFLKYAYNYDVGRGSHFWQELQKAKELRDYYTHLDVSEPRAIAGSEVLWFLETVLLGLIFPSSHLQRTLMLGEYWLYNIVVLLCENYSSYTEQPFFMEWQLHGGYQFHCNFENVNAARFPNMEELRKQREGGRK